MKKGFLALLVVFALVLSQFSAVKALAETDDTDEANVNTEDTVSADDADVPGSDEMVTVTEEAKNADEETYTLTLKASSMEGDEGVSDYKVTIPVGKSYNNGLEQRQKNQVTGHFNTDLCMPGFDNSVRLTPDPITSYSSWSQVSSANLIYTVFDEDTTVYVPLGKRITKVEITLAAPLCGTETSSAGDSFNDQVNPPQLTFPANAEYRGDTSTAHPAMWCVSVSDRKAFQGTFVAGENVYYAHIWIEPEFGYFLHPRLTTFTINGSAPVDYSYQGMDNVGMFATISAVHDPDDPVQENVVDASCTEPGSYTEVVYCKNHENCNGVISSTDKTTDPLDHDWGEWTVETEPTVDAEGLKVRICGRCEEREEEKIPAITYECTEGEDQTWIIGSGDDAVFVFERSLDPDTTFGHFEEGGGKVMVDGEELGADDFTAESGSLKVTLKSDYLETLDAGDHTLTVVFDEGSYDAAFTIDEEAEEETESESESEDETESETPPPVDGEPPEESETETETETKESETEKPSNVTPDKPGPNGPKTGDDSNIALWMLMMAASAACVAFMVYEKKRERADN